MEASKHNFVTMNEILSDVLKFVDDESYNYGSPGYYTSQVQQALEELSFDTLFDKKTLDFPVPKNLQLELPQGTFNPRQVYLFNGDLCNMSGVVNVFHKKNYFTRGNGYLAQNRGGHQGPDPFYKGNGNTHLVYENKRLAGVESGYFFGIENGVIMLSPKCLDHERIAIVVNGTGCLIGDAPIIPSYFRQTIIDYVCEVILRVAMIRDNSKTKLWQIYEQRLNKHETHGLFTGSWYNAKQRVASMSTKERNDLSEYLSRGAW